MAKIPIIAILRQMFGPVDTDELAGHARPHDPADYQLPDLDGSGPAAADIPLDSTAAGATWIDWPARTLDGCHEPLAAGAADIRGVWEVYEGRLKGHVERVEQAGNRVTITTGGLVHDMFCDGTLEGGVDDTAGIGGQRIRVAATWEDGVHKLRPANKKFVAVSRRLESTGDEAVMVWRYGPWKNRLRRLSRPPLEHPATKAAHDAANREL